ncbi:hypothetical protein [Synoicihabitans lomoniglobus]|uniref:Uncharacterized protein n=1 Tax=Synoicihabitans lomoniglobus TaxID=2909285 RepID=A0AAF0CSX1_9BACT|nr:hypothetical protein [Opitutaceae bacterium LMO-M01]WED67391.1 hypothetical protein PXH66_11075 [Opitutaceae bacterium LMO-M01]
MPNAAPSLSNSPEFFAPNNRLGDTLLWILIALLTINLPQPPLLELDSSWRRALGYFLHRGYPFGESVVFTYGPLGFLLGNTYGGLYFWAYVTFQAAFAAIAATIILVVGRPLRGVSRFCYLTFFILWGVGYHDALHMIIIAFCGWYMIKRLAVDKKPGCTLFGSFLAFLAVIKFTNLLFAGFTVLITACYAWTRGDRRNALWLAGIFGGVFLLVWLACGQPLWALSDYVINSLDVSSGYQAAMGLPTPAGQLALALGIFAGLGGYVVWHLITQKDHVRSGAILLILAAFLFLNWKHGFVRADGHMLGFFYCALVPAVAFPALFGEQNGRHRWIPRILLIIAALLSFTGMRRTYTSNIDYAVNITNEKLQRNIQAFLNWDDFRANLEGQIDHWEREAGLPKTKLLIGKDSVDVLGFEQAIALFNDFNYTPRPVFQSYSVYTPHLSELNADFLASANAPEFLLLKLQTIDERPLLMDDSHLLALFPHLYTFQLLEKDFYVFRRRAEIPPIESLRPRRLRTRDVTIGEPLSLAEFGREHLWLEIDLPFTLLGRIRNFLYKPPMVHLHVVDAENQVETYRLPLTAARAGFQINPLVTDFASYLEAHGGDAPRTVKSISVEVAESDRRFFEDQALVSLSALKPTALKTEYEKQTEREKFSMFSELPVDFLSQTPPSKIEIGSREALVMHAPSLMEFIFHAGTRHITGAHGYPPGAYSDGGETDGAVFTISWTDGTDRIELYHREIDPRNNLADRGLLDFDLDTSHLGEGRILFEISIRDNPGWDWTCWSDVTIE